MNLPHDVQAPLYDRVYRADFGQFYQWLTDTTVQVVGELVPPGARIVEFGAGTGRMALPLAALGYRVTAVEPSAPMLAVLRAAGARVTCVQRSLQTYAGKARFDLALCVFTVVIYLLDEASLRAALRTAHDSLKPGGRLLIDVPPPALFHDRRVRRRDLQRSVRVRPLGGGRYDYHERVRWLGEGGPAAYDDRFTIRCWRLPQVLAAADAAGFAFERELKRELGASGSRYLLLQRPA